MSEPFASLKYCTEDVTRKGESQPCNKEAVAMRIDVNAESRFWGSDGYPVCAFHSRAPMLSLVGIMLRRGVDLW